MGCAAPEEKMVLPADCEGALRLFDAVRGQWRTAGMAGVRHALDLTAVDIAARWLGIEPSPRLLADIGIMEGAALDMFAERSR